MKIDHIAILVENLEDALPFWQDALGLSVSKVEEVPAENARVAFLPAGESDIELVQPTDPEGSLGGYLQKKGGGLHHICLEVPDIQAVMERLAAHHITLINEQPRQREDGTLYAFVHPKSTSGVLLELYQKP